MMKSSSTGLFACSLPPLIHLLAPYCSLRSCAPRRSFRLIAHRSRAHGKKAFLRFERVVCILFQPSMALVIGQGVSSCSSQLNWFSIRPIERWSSQAGGEHGSISPSALFHPRLRSPHFKRLPGMEMNARVFVVKFCFHLHSSGFLAWIITR